MKTRKLVSYGIGFLLGWLLGNYFMHVEPAQHKTPEEMKASAVERQSSFLKDVWMERDSSKDNKWKGTVLMQKTLGTNLFQTKVARISDFEIFLVLAGKQLEQGETVEVEFTQFQSCNKGRRSFIHVIQ